MLSHIQLTESTLKLKIISIRAHYSNFANINSKYKYIIANGVLNDHFCFLIRVRGKFSEFLIEDQTKYCSYFKINKILLIGML